MPTRREHIEVIALAAFCAVLLLAPPLPLDIAFASRGLKIDQIVLFPLVALLLLRARDRASVSATLRRSESRPLWVFAGLSAATALWSCALFPDASTSTAIASIWGTLRVPLVLFVGLIMAPRLGARARLYFLWAVVGLAVIVAASATAQLFQIEPIYGFIATNYTRKADFDSVLQALDLGRAYGTFDGQPNVLGSFGVLALSVIGALLLDARSLVQRSLLAVAGCMAAWTIAISWSRGALGGAAASLMYLAWRAKRRAFLTFAAAAAVGFRALYILLPDAPRDRVEQLMRAGDDSGGSIFDSRIPLWKENWDLFVRSPVLGIRGVDSGPQDSLYIGLLVGSGIAGAAAFLIGVKRVLSRLHRDTIGDNRAIALACCAATIGWLVNGISVPSFFGERVQELYFLLVGLSLGSVGGSESNGLPSEAQTPADTDLLPNSATTT